MFSDSRLDLIHQFLEDSSVSSTWELRLERLDLEHLLGQLKLDRDQVDDAYEDLIHQQKKLGDFGEAETLEEELQLFHAILNRQGEK